MPRSFDLPSGVDPCRLHATPPRPPFQRFWFLGVDDTEAQRAQVGDGDPSCSNHKCWPFLAFARKDPAVSSRCLRCIKRIKFWLAGYVCVLNAQIIGQEGRFVLQQEAWELSEIWKVGMSEPHSLGWCAARTIHLAPPAVSASRGSYKSSLPATRTFRGFDRLDYTFWGNRSIYSG